MPQYRYLIVGGGMTAAAAVEGIRQLDQTGSIGLIGVEPDPPYKRPPLSKALWKGKPLDTIWQPIQDKGVNLHLGRQARSLDPQGKCVVDDQGTTYGYDRLLLATGGTPRHLHFPDDGVIYYRTLADYHDLRAYTETNRRFAVIGGGFIGSEIAAALAMNGKDVVMVFPETHIGGRLFPADLGQFLDGFYRDKGVEVVPGESVVGLERGGAGYTIRSRNATTSQERQIVADVVVAGIGIQPNTALAQGAGLAIDNGVVVDELLRTTAPDVYAAGDVASFPNALLGQRMRVEHEDNANTMGAWAGRALAGDEKPYDHLSYFYSDLFELGYEAVGDLDARLETVADWQEPFREGILYYLREGRVRGVLLWNVWGQVDAARRLLAEPGPLHAELRGRLPQAR